MVVHCLLARRVRRVIALSCLDVTCACHSLQRICLAYFICCCWNKKWDFLYLHHGVLAQGCRCLSSCGCDNSFETPEKGVAPISLVAQLDSHVQDAHLGINIRMKITRLSPLPCCDLCIFAVNIRKRQLFFGSCFSFSLFFLGLRNSPITKAT